MQGKAKMRWILCGLIAVFFSGLVLHSEVPGRIQAALGASWRDVPVLVLDAGHGGFDGGAVGADGTTEQQINLQIARRLRDLAGLFGIPTVMTRDSEDALEYQPGRTIRENKIADIHARQEICEAIKRPVFLSIHLNKFEQSQYYGAQVFYSGNHPSGQTLGESIQDALCNGIDNQNTRKAKRAEDSIYLMRTLQCPALIIECGFLSNPEEVKKLSQNTYQKQLSVCILSGYLRAAPTLREEL